VPSGENPYGRYASGRFRGIRGHGAIETFPHRGFRWLRRKRGGWSGVREKILNPINRDACAASACGASRSECAAHAIAQAGKFRRRTAVLSARERQALQWAVEGKNDWEIGEVMNISEHGADMRHGVDMRSSEQSTARKPWLKRFTSA
jgi:hypothetical protein